MRARVRTDTITESRETANVIVETSEGTADRVVVVGAHLDSVREGPGINDNGSGTATILEIALQMRRLGIALSNRLRFAFWGAEEWGLLGSKHYVDQLPQEELSKILLNLNFDMLELTQPRALRLRRRRLRGWTQSARLARPRSRPFSSTISGARTSPRWRHLSTAALTMVRLLTRAFRPAASSLARKASRRRFKPRSSVGRRVKPMIDATIRPAMTSPTTTTVHLTNSATPPLTRCCTLGPFHRRLLW